MSLETNTPIRTEPRTTTHEPAIDPWMTAEVVPYYPTADQDGNMRSGLLDASWLQVARSADVEGALHAKSYQDLVASQPTPEAREALEQTIASYGDRFDEALLAHVRTIYIMNALARKSFGGYITIRAQVPDDADIHAPLGGWQAGIPQLVRDLADIGQRRTAAIRVEQVRIESGLPAGVQTSDAVESRW